MNSTNSKTSVSREDMSSLIDVLVPKNIYGEKYMTYQKEQGMWPVNMYLNCTYICVIWHTKY